MTDDSSVYKKGPFSKNIRKQLVTIEVTVDGKRKTTRLGRVFDHHYLEAMERRKRKAAVILCEEL